MTNDKNAIHLGGTARSPGDVERIYDLGLQFAEIPVPDPDEFSGIIDDYRDVRDRSGLYYLCHGPREGDPNDTGSLEKSYLPKLFETLRLMSKLEVSLLTIHLWLDSRFVKEDVIEFKIELLRRVIHRAMAEGITICLENLSEHAAHLMSPFKRLPSLNLTLDIGHAQLLTDVNTSYEFMGQYPERIKHIHLHDNKGGDSSVDDLHLPPGKGIIDFEDIFKKLRAIGYHHTITLELPPVEIERCLEDVKNLIFQHPCQIYDKPSKM